MIDVLQPDALSGKDLSPGDMRPSLPVALARAREAVMERFRPLLTLHDINEQQWRVLLVLSAFGPLDAAELAARAGLLPPSLTRMIRALTARGLMHRTPNRKDKRRIILVLTPAGQAAIDHVSPESQRIYHTLIDEFGPEQATVLLALLERLIDTARAR